MILRLSPIILLIFFSSLFCRATIEEEGNLAQVDASYRISRDQVDKLNRRVPMKEVKKAVFGMKKYGSLGPDGIPAVFYQHFWEEVGSALTGLVSQALDMGSVPNFLLQAFMTLIAKKDILDFEDGGKLQANYFAQCSV